MSDVKIDRLLNAEQAGQLLGLRVSTIRRMTYTEVLGAFWDVVAQYQPDAVWEVRGPKTKRKGPRRFFGTLSGYFDNKPAFIAAVQDITGEDVEALYFTLNPVGSALLARAANRLKDQATETTRDTDIVRRTTLLLDFDPARPSGISSTDAERDAALAVRDVVQSYPADEHGWPAPLAVTMSGNGGALLYRVELLNDAEATALIERVLKALAHLFDTDAMKVDTANYNAARITKIIGTVAAKGDNIPERPWRLAVGNFNPDASPVPREALERVAALAPEHEPPHSRASDNGAGERRLDLREMLNQAGIRWREKVKTGYVVLQLDRCLTSQDHTDGAALFELASGAVAYRCLHNRCAGTGWQDVRELLLGKVGGRLVSGPAGTQAGQASTSTGKRDEKRHTQAQALVELAGRATLLHGPDHETGYATFEVDDHAETWSLRSKGFKRWLVRQFYEEHGKPPSAQAVADALGMMEAKAQYDGPKHQVFARVAEDGGNIYLDLADEKWHAVEVTPDSWRVVDAAPVKFRRSRGMLALPEPEHGGDLTALRPFVNVASEGDWRLYLGFCLAALRPAGPYMTVYMAPESARNSISIC